LLSFLVLVLFCTEVTSIRSTTGNSKGNSQCTCSDSKPKPHLLDPTDVAILLIDHQSGLLQTVHDVPIRDMRANVKVLAQLSVIADLPLITTASVPEGPNGPLLPEVTDYANGTYVARTGEISAWEKDDFVDAVAATGKKTLVMAGIWTSVCIAFPALQAIADGYTVYAVIDASGDLSTISSFATQIRMAQEGVILTTTNALVAEIQRTWRRLDWEQYGALYPQFAPNYGIVVESYNGAQQAAHDSS
jgi:nicotinamidase-related amidase